MLDDTSIIMVKDYEESVNVHKLNKQKIVE
jgi:hypothetical protein